MKLNVVAQDLVIKRVIKIVGTIKNIITDKIHTTRLQEYVSLDQ